MADLQDITRLADRMREKTNELLAEMEDGGNLDVCAEIAEEVESISTTLRLTFRDIRSNIADEVCAQFKPAAEAA